MFSSFSVLKLHDIFFKGMIEAPASIIVNRLFDEVELLPTWNRLVTESKKLQVKYIFFNFA